ncbi:hypothetical protein HOD83_00190 [Candidatus Woesearchaeota archaeon]|jgi:hypothetical protein|nr:hypothetical protein [Candidatus Woesearchaeota archaeon]MBT4114506.1 hypothetical protein [Candidatus Woesearchaeota archaeon]MBT4247999.1 hypothetical protein [Candidatus Woesearchaeota archaeon]
MLHYLRIPKKLFPFIERLTLVYSALTHNAEKVEVIEKRLEEHGIPCKQLESLLGVLVESGSATFTYVDINPKGQATVLTPNPDPTKPPVLEKRYLVPGVTIERD